MKTKNRRLCRFLSLLLFVLVSMSQSAPANAESSTLQVQRCKVTFETVGSPTMIQISGRSEAECSGTVVITNDQLTTGQFQMPLDKLDTGIALRNKHLRENYLHIEQFPLAKLKLTSVEALADQLNNKATGRNKFEALLELKGKEAPVMDATYEKKGPKISAKFSLDLPNHGIDRPAFMGIKIVDKVFVTVQFEL